MQDSADTICALSTPPGRSGIAVVRLSGTSAYSILQKICAGKSPSTLSTVLPEPRQAFLRRLLDPQSGEEIDEALVTFFESPHSYTGEDLVEFSLHGNPALVAALVNILCRLGARLAEPGEFTSRAFLHGRMDLVQAEAVHDIIEARTLYQAQVASRQRDGALARELQPVKSRLIDTIVDLESAVEFAEENLPTASQRAMLDTLDDISRKMEGWLQSFRKGRVIREGLVLAIVGAPNVGKSSLFNALLGRERSIVTDVPGTTRDLVADEVAIGGIPVRLEDTAGLRADGDAIEKLGMARSRHAVADADAILLVVDTSRNLTEADFQLRNQLMVSVGIVVLNKSDLPSRVTEMEKQTLAGAWPCVDTSAKTGMGVEAVRALILKQIFSDGKIDRDGLLITNLRHCQALERAQDHLHRGREALEKGLSEEFALSDLRKTLDSLGEITGETSTEDLLDQIFSRFCIGK